MLLNGQFYLYKSFRPGLSAVLIFPACSQAGVLLQLGL